MKKGLFTSLLFILLFSTSFAQWNNLGPWPNANYPGGSHGIAVSPDGKVWQASYYKTNWHTPNGDDILTSPILVYNADGSFVDTIYTVTSGSHIDTLGLGGGTSGCRGLAVDADGNILYTSGAPSKIVKINYQTLEGMGSRLIINEIGSSPTAPSVSSDGTIYVGPVVGGGTSAIAMYGSDLTPIGSAVVGPPNIARTIEVSADGLSLYWIPFTSVPPQIYIYTRSSDLEEFALTDSVLQGMAIESSAWQPGTGLLWVSNSTAGTGPYTPFTWYGFDVTTKTIVDSFTLPNPIPGAGDALPRALDFSPDGKIAYVGLFGTVFNRIYKFDTTPPTEYNVTFSVDMGVQAFENSFDPATDHVWVRGDFQSDAGDPNGNWQGNLFELTDTDGDTVYTITVTFPLSSKDKQYNYKFVKSPDNWESDPPNGPGNRLVTINAANINIPKAWFNNDKTYTVIAEVTNTINFTADITDIIGIGAGGAYDPAVDSLMVEGLDWDNLGKDVVGNRRLMAENPFAQGILTTSLTFTSGSAAPNGVGDSTKWKFQAFPNNRFGNNGWETGGDRWYYYQAEGTTTDFPTIVPRIYPLFGALTNDVPLEFNLDVTGAKNRYNGEAIPADQIEFVGLRGGADFLGNWNSGTWTPADTTTGLMKVLTKVSETMWKYNTIVPAGTNAGAFEYKFAAMYPDADTVNGGSSPLDNEGGFGTNHLLLLSDNPDGFVLHNTFGVFGTPDDVKPIKDVIPNKYDLSQNYPNPFNPNTTIRYSIPAAGLVTVKVFNLLGQQVATLVNTQQATGAYEVNFDASSLASGIYFYTLEVNNFKATKKMILMK